VTLASEALAFEAFGLSLRVTAPLPGIAVRQRPPRPEADVRIWLQCEPPLPERSTIESCVRYVSPERADSGQPNVVVRTLLAGAFLEVRYGDGVCFLIDKDGEDLWVSWPEDRTLEDAVVYLFGPALALALRLRQITCLHASAVVIDDAAVVFLGPAGAGKSTTAAAFRKLGFTVLADDVVALTPGEDGYVAQPAHPQLRLWPDTVAGLYGSADALPRLVPTDPVWDKRFLPLEGDALHHAAVPVGAIYTLETSLGGDDDLPIAPLTPRSALITLASNTYLNYLLNAETRAADFRVLTWIARHVPMRTAHVGRDLRHINRLTDAILRDFRTCRDSSAPSGGVTPLS